MKLHDLFSRCWLGVSRKTISAIRQMDLVNVKDGQSCIFRSFGTADGFEPVVTFTINLFKVNLRLRSRLPWDRGRVLGDMAEECVIDTTERYGKATTYCSSDVFWATPIPYLA